MKIESLIGVFSLICGAYFGWTSLTFYEFLKLNNVAAVLFGISMGFILGTMTILREFKSNINRSAITDLLMIVALPTVGLVIFSNLCGSVIFFIEKAIHQ